MEIPVLFCIDGNFWQHLGVSIASLLRSNPVNRFRIIVASVADMEEERLADIRSIISRLGESTFEAIVFKEAAKYDYLPVLSHITFAMYIRLFMTEYLDPTLDKIIYLDSDVIVCSDIADLWQIDLGEAYLGAVPEPFDFSQRTPLGFGPEDLYINSGVLLVNLKKWRSDNVLDRFIEFADAHQELIRSPDQDILNCVFRGQILNVGYQWNWQALFPRFLPEDLGLSAKEFSEFRRHPRIVHFTSRYKPWYYRWEPHYKSLYYDALSKTPWANYVPPDKTLPNLRIKIIKMLQQKLEWHLPKIAKDLRMRSRASA